MLRKVRLYGQLAEFVGRKVIEADLSSAAEAVRMLIANFPGLDVHMADRHYKVLVGESVLTPDDLHNPVGREEIKIVPVIVGAGGGVNQIFAGVALIGLTLIPGGLPIAGTLATKIGLLGGALVLGGVAQLITPTPEIPQGPDTVQDPRKSFSFSGIQNTSRGGTPVPIVYGKTLTGSVVISAGIDTEQVRA
tara:strand:- start:2267 stop:2842 length:576 start_codon:yes stop_codon:yes gene_type:complete